MEVSVALGKRVIDGKRRAAYVFCRYFAVIQILVRYSTIRFLWNRIDSLLYRHTEYMEDTARAYRHQSPPKVFRGMKF